MRTARVLLAVCAVSLLASSCGGSSSESSSDASPVTTVQVEAKYALFCAASTALDNAMGGTHGEDPTAITDPALMKTAWAQIAQLSAKLRDVSPAVVRKDATAMVDSVLAIDAIFKANDYDLLAMAKKENVRIELEQLSSNPKLLESSEIFNTFLVDNCGKVLAPTPQN
jgi:cytochrome c556